MQNEIISNLEYIVKYTDIGMLIATIFMAIFAGLSWRTAVSQKKSQEELLINQQKSQENLLEAQNKIQQKQLLLALLKEKQEIREDFRNFIISRRNNLSDVVYKCKAMSLSEFRDQNIKDYVVLMRLGDLFGQVLKQKADSILKLFEDILSFETQQIVKNKLFENGWRHPDREQKIKPDLLEKYRKTHENNMHYLVEANELFIEIMQEIGADINYTAEQLK